MMDIKLFLVSFFRFLISSLIIKNSVMNTIVSIFAFLPWLELRTNNLCLLGAISPVCPAEICRLTGTLGSGHGRSSCGLLAGTRPLRTGNHLEPLEPSTSWGRTDGCTQERRVCGKTHNQGDVSFMSICIYMSAEENINVNRVLDVTT